MRAAGSTRGHLAELDVDVLVVAEQLAQREGDVARGELRRRHLVEQRLELVVVVAVDQRDARRRPRARAAWRSRRRRSRRRRRRRAAARSVVTRHARPPCRLRGDAHAVEQVVARRAARWPSRSAPGSPRRCSGRSSCRRRRGCRPRARGSRCRAPTSPGSVPKRHVPAWCAQPATGMSFLRYAWRGIRWSWCMPSCPSSDLSSCSSRCFGHLVGRRVAELDRRRRRAA